MAFSRLWVAMKETSRHSALRWFRRLRGLLAWVVGIVVSRIQSDDLVPAIEWLEANADKVAPVLRGVASQLPGIVGTLLVVGLLLLVWDHWDWIRRSASRSRSAAVGAMRASRAVLGFLKASPGVFLYVWITAIGWVRVRYATRHERVRDDGIWDIRWAGKGKLEHFPFHLAYPWQQRFTFDIPAIYHLHFSTPAEHVKWTDVVEGDRRLYVGEPLEPIFPERGHGRIEIAARIGTGLGFKAGWEVVRMAFRLYWRAPCQIARMGWVVVTPPNHPAYRARYRALLDLTDRRGRPKPEDPPDYTEPER